MRRNRLFIVSLTIVLIVTLVPGDGKIAGNYIDKVVHFIVFLLLSINIAYKFQNSEALMRALFAAIILGYLTEIAQQFIPGRNMDIYDGLADTLGIIAGYFIYQRKGKRIDKAMLKLRA
ncbi:MAG: VanZ family protein [Prolixibacteraceae bacterium]|jgi:VanZ family protein|nr:VanZ family protein [Prolixibacteraceae bacterium]